MVPSYKMQLSTGAALRIKHDGPDESSAGEVTIRTISKTVKVKSGSK